jgi:hypothetical protein
MSKFEKVIYRVPAPFSAQDFVEVYGDPEMAWYEWRVVSGGAVPRVLRDSKDAGYGVAECALRDALIEVTQ